MDQAHDASLMTLLNTLIVSLAAILIALTGLILAIGKVILMLMEVRDKQAKNKADANKRSDSVNDKLDKNMVVSSRAAENSEAVKSKVDELPAAVTEVLKNGAGDHIAEKMAKKVESTTIQTVAKELAAEKLSARSQKIYEDGIIEGLRRAEIAKKAAETDQAIPIPKKKE